MAKQEQREIALNFITNAEETKSKVDALLNSLDKTDDSYADLEQQSASLESAITDVNNAMDNSTGSSNILQNSIKKLEGETNKATTSLNNVKRATDNQAKSTSNLTKEVTANGGAMAILDTLTGGLASTTRDGIEAMGLFTTGTTASTIAQKAYTAVVGTSTGALKAFRIALAATGIGLAVVAVIALVQAYKSFTEATDEATEAQRKLNAEMANNQYEETLSRMEYLTEVRRAQAQEQGASIAQIRDLERKAAEERLKELDRRRKDERLTSEQVKKAGEDYLQQQRRISLQEARWRAEDAESSRNLDKQRSSERVALAQKTSAQLKQLELERFEFDKKIQDLRDELFIGSAVSPTDELIKKNEIQIRKLNEARDKELQDLKKLHKETTDSYKNASRVINETYDARVKKIEDSTGEVTKYYQEYLGLSLEFIKDIELAVTPDSLLTYYDNVLKFIDGIKSSDIKKYYEEILKPDEVKENIKYIQDLHKTWMDFDEQLREVSYEGDDLDAVAGSIRKMAYNQKAALEEQAEDQIQRLQDLRLITKEEADILRESSEARMDIIDQMSEAELEAYNKQRELRTQKLLDNEFALELEKYFANKSIEIQEEQTRKLEELEERRLEKKRANSEAEIAIVSASADAQAATLDMVLSFMSDEDAERTKATGAYKTLAIATATMDTYAAAIAGYKGAMQTFANPIVGNIVGIASIATAVSTGIAQINAIRKVKVPGGGSGGGGGSISASAGAAPNVSFVSSSENQIANSVNANTNAQNQEPIKAYVVSGDVSSGQALERNKIESNSI